MRKWEQPLEKDTRNREDINKWLAIQQSFMAGLQEDITNEKLQLSFCEPWSPEYEYRTKNLQALYHVKETYGK